MTTLLAVLSVLGAILAIFPFRRFGLALVFLSLFVYVVWGEDISLTGRWFFWIFFAIALLYTLFAGYTRRRGVGVGLAMLVFSIVLASDWQWTRPFEGWPGLTTIVIVIAVVLIALLFGLLLKAALIIGAIALLLILFGVPIGNFIGAIDVPSAIETPQVTVPASPTAPATPTTSDEPTTNRTTEPTDNPSSVHLGDPEVPDHLKGSAPPTSDEYLQTDMPIVDWEQGHTSIPEED